MATTRLFPDGLTNQPYVPRPFAYYFRQWSNYHMPFHQHDTMEIMYMIQGTCQIEFHEPAHNLQTFVLKNGEFVILDANIPHRLLVSAQDPCRMLNVEFNFEYQPDLHPTTMELVQEEPTMLDLWLANQKIMKLSDPDDVFYVMKSVVLELDAPTPNRLMVHLLFNQLLIRIARIVKNSTEHLLSPSASYIQETINYMQQHLDQDIQVNLLATHVNLHPGYLQRIFKQQMNVTMMDYLTRLRIEKAKKLLLHTRIPIIDISYYVGIGSRPYFHYLFKKHTAMTPSAYRQSMHTHRAADDLEVIISDINFQNK